MTKAALFRLENHGEDVRLSTLARYAEATGRPLSLKISPSAGHRPGKHRLAAAVELASA
jgi:hypothetical protein